MGWTLSVKLIEFLQIFSISLSAIPNALVLNNKDNPITSKPITVYETKSTNYNKNQEID